MSDSHQGENVSSSARYATHSSRGASFSRGASPTATISITSPRQPPTQVEPSSKRSRSEVWLNMRKVLIDGDQFAICGICEKRLSAKPSNGTRHLRDHVFRCLKKKIKEKEIMYKRYRDEAESAKMMEEEKALKQLRRTLVPHARPVPNFNNPFLPQKSGKDITKPKPPKLLVDKRKERRKFVGL